jgi:hypothetical protein
VSDRATAVRGYRVTGLDHVLLAMPPGGEDAARAFFAGVLGLPEVPKPATLASRGGCWFECGAQQLHLGVAADFAPAHKAHPALLVTGPFGNRLELVATG